MAVFTILVRLKWGPMNKKTFTTESIEEHRGSGLLLFQNAKNGHSERETGQRIPPVSLRSRVGMTESLRKAASLESESGEDQSQNRHFSRKERARNGAPNLLELFLISMLKKLRP